MFQMGLPGLPDWLYHALEQWPRMAKSYSLSNHAENVEYLLVSTTRTPKTQHVSSCFIMFPYLSLQSRPTWPMG